MSEAERQAANPDSILGAFTDALERGSFPRMPSPAFVYTFFRYCADVQGVNDFETYFSTVMTSGGAILPDHEGHVLPFGEAFRRNSQYAFDLASGVMLDNPGLLSKATAVNPVALGKVPVYHYENYGTIKVDDGFWGQDDFLRLWFGVILGMHAPAGPDGHDWLDTELYTEELFDVHAEVSKEWATIMNDKTADPDVRQNAYMLFTTSFLQCVQTMQEASGLEINPVDRIVRLIDTSRTLGGRAEVQLGKAQNIFLFDVALAGNDWEAKGLGGMAEDLGNRQAEFAAAPGRLVLALASANNELPDTTGASTHPYRARLSQPALSCMTRFMDHIRIREDAPESAAQFMRSTATVYEFQARRREAYHPDAVHTVLNTRL